MRIAINSCYGGFDVSEKAKEMFNISTNEVFKYRCGDNRTDEKLLSAIDELGAEVNTDTSDLEIVEVPDDATDYVVIEDDGKESVYYVVGGKIYTAVSGYGVWC